MNCGRFSDDINVFLQSKNVDKLYIVDSTLVRGTSFDLNRRLGYSSKENRKFDNGQPVEMGLRLYGTWAKQGFTSRGQQ